MQRRMKLKALVSMLLAVAMLCSMLVGCKSSDDPGNSQPETALGVDTALKNTKLDGEKDDSQHRLTTTLGFTPEPAGHGHPAIEGGPDWSLQPLLYETLCDYSSLSDENFRPQLLESFDVDGKVLTLKLRDGLKYSDGSPITADDILNNMYMDMSVQNLMVYAESIEKLDDLTIRITYTKDSQLIRTYLLKSMLMYSYSEYGKWGDVFRDIFENMRELNDDGDYKLTEEGQKLYDETTLDLNTYLPRMTEIKTSGAYYISTVTSDEITLSANPYYRNKLDIDTIVGVRRSSAEAFQIAVQSGELDLEADGLSTELALRIAKENKDTIRQVGIPAYEEWGFCMNVNKYPTDKLEVRQAIAYIVNKEQIAPATEPGMLMGDEYAAGLPLALRDKYLSQEQLSTLTRYDLDLEKATELLESIGWTKQNGQWVDETGTVPEIEITGIGSFQVCLIMGEAVANELNEFGIKASFVSKEVSAYSDYSQSGQAHMVIDSFGGCSATQHPYEAYAGIWWYGKRMNLEFPPSGEKLVWKDDVTGEDFHMEDVVNQLKLANTDEEASKYVYELAKFYNDNLWFIPVTDKCLIFRIHNDKLSMPSVPTGEAVYDFVWSGGSSGILSKMIHSGELYFVK